MSEELKKFTGLDEDIKLVYKPNDLDPFDDDPGVLRAVLSCGHITDPATLTDACKAQLNDGETELKCPVCEKNWPYDEVRKLAKLTMEEKFSFEDTIERNSVKDVVKECPGCGTFVDRLNVSNLCVECSVCTVKKGRVFEFCWQCERVWKGPRPRSDQCGNVGCRSAGEELLRDCPMVTLKSVKYKETGISVQCPAIRACPFCEVLIEHAKSGCKIITCNACKKQFCFLCLKPAAECLETATHFIVCSAGVAPKQTF